MKIFKSLLIFFFILRISNLFAADLLENSASNYQIQNNPIYEEANKTKSMPSWQNSQDRQPTTDSIFVRNILDRPDLSSLNSTKSDEITLSSKNPNKNLLPKVPDFLFTPKDPTPSRIFSANLSMPSYFETSNNLAKKPGSFYRAFGEIIFIQGKITDSFNIPITGAIIEIWQTNSAGKYHSLLEPNSEYIDKYFSMSGRAVTDNLGNYYFVTIMPGSYLGRAPHINMNIYHQKFGKIETEFYFENHPLNQSDYQYLSYSLKERAMLTAKVRLSNIIDSKSIKICTFNIVMTGTHDYKSFGGPL
jgi:protocatechuate 3,4-dioxygenase beta subunit